MTLPTIQDFLADFPGWATLSPNEGDETSNTAGGVTLVKELRPMFWQLDAVSVTLSPTILAKWKAKLKSLQNGKKLFYGFDKTNYYPLAYPKGSWPTGSSFSGIAVAVNTVVDNYNITLKSLPNGYQGSVGDYISITYGGSNQLSLHQVMEDFTVASGGISSQFQIEPYLPPGVVVNDVVAVKRPACTMMLVPGSVTYPSASDSWGQISFKGQQVP